MRSNVWLAPVGAGNALGEADLTALVSDVNPIAELDEGCIGAKLDISQIAKGEVHLEIEPTSSGLEITGWVDDLDITRRVVVVAINGVCTNAIEAMGHLVDDLLCR